MTSAGGLVWSGWRGRGCIYIVRGVGTGRPGGGEGLPGSDQGYLFPHKPSQEIYQIKNLIIQKSETKPQRQLFCWFRDKSGLAANGKYNQSWRAS